MSLKLTSSIYLDELGIDYEMRAFPTMTEKGAANVAKALGFRPHQMVKTLIFESGEGECVLVMVGGDRSANSGSLKKAIGNRKKVTGYEVGSVPPFHWQTQGFRSFIDESLMSEPLLGVGSGVWGQEIIITANNLVKASQAIVVNLTVPDRTSA